MYYYIKVKGTDVYFGGYNSKTGLPNWVTNKEDALVFYQFGKYLTKVPGEPIIDQHILRAFAIYTSTDMLNIKNFRKMKSVGKKQISLIIAYKAWLTSNEITEDLKKEADYSYHIDKLLFAAGKTVKSID